MDRLLKKINFTDVTERPKNSGCSRSVLSSNESISEHIEVVDELMQS